MNYSQVLPLSTQVNMSYNSALLPTLTDDAHVSPQYTVASPISFAGIGLHTGKLIHVKLLPAPANTGIVFYRTDLGNIRIPALYHNVVDTNFSTVIASPDYPEARIGTIEHLMSALSGNQINNVIIQCNGPEIPVLDGSAAKFTTLLQQTGWTAHSVTTPVIKITRPVRVEYGDAFAELRPSPENQLSLSLSIDFPASIIGRQHFDMILNPQNFQKELSFCRTFTFKEEIDSLHKMGLAQGGSLQNAIVVNDDRILNPEGLYCPNEFVKHKMLDAIGDLSLIGHKIYGKFIGHKSGHKLNNLLLCKLMKEQNAWLYHQAPTYHDFNEAIINEPCKVQSA